MARIAIPVTVSTHDGITYPTVTASNPTNDHEIANNDGSIILIAENISGTTRTVVVKCAASFGSPAIPLTDRTVTLLTAAKKTIGPFSRRLFNQQGDLSANSVLVNVDGTAADVSFVALSSPIPVA